MRNLAEILHQAIARKASDLQLIGNLPPRIRVNCAWEKMSLPVLSPADCQDICLGLMTVDQQRSLDIDRKVTFIKDTGGTGHFRIHVYYQHGSLAALFRPLPVQLPAAEELGIPQVVMDFSLLPRGLVIIAGGGDSGKSTTLNFLLQQVGQKRAVHMMCFGHPSELIVPDHLSSLSLIDVGNDLNGKLNDEIKGKSAEVAGYDIGFVGFDSAIECAESGVLTFLVLPVNSMSILFARLSSYKERLASVLHAVIIQNMAPGMAGRSVMIPEILISTPEVQEKIRLGKFEDLSTIIKREAEKTGMRTLNQSLLQQLLRRKIEMRKAFEVSRDPEELDSLLSKAGV